MILAIDTSTKKATIALYGPSLYAEYTWMAHQTHSAQLLPAIEWVLKNVPEEAEERPASRLPEAVAVAAGPGSYTGLRVGIATAKALGLAWDVPLIGLSTLEAMAYAHSQTFETVCPILTAGREEFYAGLYGYVKRQWSALRQPAILSLEEVINWVERDTLFVGDLSQAAREKIAAKAGSLALFPKEADNQPRAAYLAELAWQKFNKQKRFPPVEAIYLRQPLITKPTPKKWGVRKTKAPDSVLI